MAWVYDDRQMRLFLQHGNRGNIQGIPHGSLECADTSLTENHILIASCHNIFCAHEQFIQGIRHAAFEENGLFQLSELFQKLKVLHISGADLDHIHILK